MPSQPELELADPSRHSEIVTHTSEEFYAAIARADEWVMREKAWVQVREGEYAVEWISMFGNGGWKIKIRWNDPQ